MALTLVGRLLCAAQQAYCVTPDGKAQDSPSGPNDPTPLPSSLVGWVGGLPRAWADGVGRIDAALLGLTASEIILAFRGTEPFGSPDPASVIDDWANDLAADLVPSPDAQGRVHQGFLGSLDALWPNVGPAVAALVAANPGMPLYITGHSKGGALANLAAARLVAAGGAGALYVCTFAAARPGDQDFAADYDAKVPHSTRYEYGDDIVPHLPPEDSLLVSLLQRAPLLSDAIPGFTDSYASVGALIYFANPQSPPQADSIVLQGQRLASLTERILTGQFGKIVNDHSLAPGYGYASAICPGEWPPAPGQ